MDQTPAHPLRSPQVVQVVSRPGALVAAIGVIVGLLVLGVVFVSGVAIGAITIVAGSSLETPVVPELYRDGNRNNVAIIPVEGSIDSSQAETFRIMVDYVLADSSYRAAVLRVDSPGGGISPSDQIWYQVQRLRDEGLPVVASFGGVAASGGYYISCHADRILAEPTCITGSIGVIAQAFIFKDLLDKVGIEPVTLMSTDSPEKDVGNPFREWTERDREQYLSMLDAAYDIFNQRVRDGRKKVITDPAAVDALADGSIYTASEALGHGLIDGIGYLDDAIAAAEKAAGLPGGRSTVVILRKTVSLFGGVLGSAAPQPWQRLPDGESLRTLVNDLSAPRLMYLMR